MAELFQDFALQALSPPGCRVLEIGAGDGQLADALRRAGFDVLAINPAADDVAGVVPVAIEDLDASTQPFTAVIANRSLHHVLDLDVALATIADLLIPGGTLVVQEFAWDQVDDTTGAWMHREGRRLGVVADDEPGDAWLQRWRNDHRELATFAQLIDAFDRHFTRRAFSWIAYLAQEYLDGDAEAVRRERELLERGRIRPTAFRYIGRP